MPAPEFLMEATEGRATRNMDRFSVRKSGASLAVDVSRVIQSDVQKAA